MGQEYTAKSFRSGNSVAIRVPAALGIVPDREWIIEERDGHLVLRPKDSPKRKFNIDKIWGSAQASGIRPIDENDRWFDERALVRDDPDADTGHVPAE